MSATLKNIAASASPGSRFRPVHWSDISKPGAPTVGWGIEEKPAGQRRYVPRGIYGKVHPFASKAEAQKVCHTLNAAALVTGGAQ